MALCKCIWCGRQFRTKDDYTYDGVIERHEDFCGEKCRREYQAAKSGRQERERKEKEQFAALKKQNEENLRAMERERAAMAAALEKDRRERERAEVERENRERKEREEQAERERKNDPSRWYGSEWAEYLIAHPDDPSQCNWTKLSGDDWALLLSRQPQFSDKCVWSKLSSKNIRQILQRQECLITDERLSKLGATSWAKLLEVRPGLIDRCSRIRDFKSEDWLSLLQQQPRLAGRCDWGRVESKDLVALLRTTSGLDVADNILSRLRADEWVEILRFNSSYSSRFDFGKLEHEQVVDLLIANSGYATKCNLSTLNGDDWTRALLANPKLSTCCSWEKLAGYNWARLLLVHQELSSKCDKWAEIGAGDWVSLLLKYPEFSKWCPWDRLDIVPAKWQELMIAQPQFATKCNRWSDFRIENLHELFSNRLEISDAYDGWERLSGADWSRLLLDFPSLAGKCNKWNEISGEELLALFLRHDELIDFCDHWENLKGNHWVQLMIHRPRVVSRFDLSKLGNNDKQKFGAISTAALCYFDGCGVDRDEDMACRLLKEITDSSTHGRTVAAMAKRLDIWGNVSHIEELERTADDDWAREKAGAVDVVLHNMRGYDIKRIKRIATEACSEFQKAFNPKWLGVSEEGAAFEAFKKNAWRGDFLESGWPVVGKLQKYGMIFYKGGMQIVGMGSHDRWEVSDWIEVLFKGVEKFPCNGEERICVAGQEFNPRRACLTYDELCDFMQYIRQRFFDSRREGVKLIDGTIQKKISAAPSGELPQRASVRDDKLSKPNNSPHKSDESDAAYSTNKRRLAFIVIGLLFGMFGLHLVYARRWKLLLLHWAFLVAAGVVQIAAVVPVAFWLLGTFFIKNDGNGKRMQ